MTIQMKKVVTGLFVGMLFLFVGTQSADAQCDDASKEAKVYAVMFHADYCGACKTIAPSVTALQEKLDGKPVHFVKMDRTSDETKKLAYSKAADLGLEDVYKKSKGTGFVILVDAESKKEIGRLTTKHSVEDMLATVIKGLE
jgi:thiol-disulfide isomerase/thioredoxin